MRLVAAAVRKLKGGARRLRTALLTFGGRPVYLGRMAVSGERWPRWRASGWRDLTVAPRFTAPLTRKRAGSGRYIDLTLALDLPWAETARYNRSEEHTSELQSRGQLVCRLLPEKKKQAAEQTARRCH